MANEITVIDYEDNKLIETLKSTVASGLNKEEFALFVEHCKGTGLNPFKKEIWAIKAGGRLQLMTGNQGFHTIANSHQQYDGIETGFISPEGEFLSIAYPKEDYIGAWAKVYRKDRKIPTVAVAMLKEYDKGHGNWKTMRRIMIVKCAESLGLRKSFPQELNGLYTKEEMPSEFSASAVKEKPEESKPIKAIKEKIKLKTKSVEDTLQAMKEQRAFVYLIPKLTGAVREANKELYIKNGCTTEEGFTFCSVEVPEWADYLQDAGKPEVEVESAEEFQEKFLSKEESQEVSA